MRTRNVQDTRKQSCAELVAEVAERQIEAIRLMLCPGMDDVEFNEETGVLSLGDVEIEVPSKELEGWRDDDGDLDSDEIIEDRWDDLCEAANTAWYEHGLSFSYMTPEDGEHYWCYLISWGGPSSEIRFYANYDLTLYRAEFWYMDWFDGASVAVTRDDTIVRMWDEFTETETAEAVRHQALDE